MKALANDLNRIVAIYAISAPLGRALGVKKTGSTAQVIRNDLLNDLLALMFYHEVVKHQGLTRSFQDSMSKFGVSEAMAEDLLKTVVLLLASSVLSGKFHPKTFLYAVVGVCIYHLVVRPVIINSRISDTVDFEAIEDLAENIILLGLDSGDLNDMVSKLAGLMVYHQTMKL